MELTKKRLIFLPRIYDIFEIEEIDMKEGFYEHISVEAARDYARTTMEIYQKTWKAKGVSAKRIFERAVHNVGRHHDTWDNVDWILFAHAVSNPWNFENTSILAGIYESINNA